MRAFLAAALVALIVVAAGCGGSAFTGSTSDPALGTDAAQLVPPDALAFASIDTDQSSQQWRRLDQLTRGLGARQQVLQKLNAALGKHGLSYDADVRPAVGKELDVAVLKSGDSATPEVVAFAKPDDQAKLRALASKFDQGNEHYTVQQIGGWSVVADSPDTFAAVRAAQGGRSLGDTGAYSSAQSQLGGDAIVRLYAASGAFASLAKQLGATGAKPPAWTAAKVDVGGDTIRASAAAAGDVVPAPAASTLLRDVPSGAALAVSFNGTRSLARALRGAKTQTMPLKPTTLSLQQLGPLLTGPGALYVRARGLVPEVAVELAPSDPQAALARARSILAGSAGKLGPIQLTPQLVGGKLVISDSPAAAALRGGAKLVDDAAFKDTLQAAGTPKRTSALVYADMPQLAPFLQLAAPALGGKALDPALVDTLDHLGSVVAWATRAGGTSRFELWVHRR
jgi:Protein of unknown function (DUF3352)